MSLPNPCEGFKYGGNYAWNNFGMDIGGGADGFAANSATVCADFQDMADHCVEIVRVWMFADLRSPALSFDANECVTGIGGTSQADIEALSQCAANAGIKLMWTITAHPANETDLVQGTARPKIRNSIVDATCRQMFMDNLISPITNWIVNDPNYAATFHSYDLFNEPEWLIDDSNPVNPSQPFNDYHLADMGAGNSVTYNQMYTFLDDMASTIRSQDANSCITVGSAGKKWGTAWEPIVDFNSPHSYNWDEAYFPATSSPSAYGYTKPTMIGEYPPGGMAANSNFIGQVAGALPKTQNELLCEYAENGWFAALAWAYFENDSVDNPDLIWQGSAIDEGLAFQNNEVKRGRFLFPTALNYECGVTQNLVISPESNKGQHVPIDESTFSLSAGTVNNITYDTTNCNYIVNWTAPDCSFTGDLDITATDTLGNNMVGLLPEVKTTECTTTSSCVLNFGNCNAPVSSCTLNFGEATPETICDDSVICTVNVSCQCKASITQIKGGDPTCPNFGEIFEWVVNGCNCSGRCGPLEVKQKAGSNSSEWCFFTDTGILRLGPVSDLSKIQFSVKCLDKDFCINYGQDPENIIGGDCTNHSVFITDPNSIAFVSPSDLAVNAAEVVSVITQTNQNVAAIAQSGISLAVSGTGNGQSTAIVVLKDQNGNYYNCQLNIFVDGL